MSTRRAAMDSAAGSRLRFTRIGSSACRACCSRADSFREATRGMRNSAWLGAAALALVPFVAVLRTAPASAPPVVNDGHGDYVYVPAGSFHMGDTFGDGEARERPAHVVDLDAFYIGKFEMTNGEWKTFRSDPSYDDPKFW